MCSAPKVSPATQYQQSQSPIYSDADPQTQTGRRGTILTGGGGVQSVSPTMKKTVLGQ